MSSRLLNLTLSWFRGASNELHFDPQGKNVVVFGPNGSGKSSIVDGLEFLLSGGRVEHLTHEYSGRRYERSVPNTHVPAGFRPELKISMTGGVEASATIQKNNVPQCLGLEGLEGWSASRSLIRQERLAAFVSAKKTDKYAAVVPLMGLGPLEIAAGTLRALKNEVASTSTLQKLQADYANILHARQAAFPGMTPKQVGDAIKSLQATYLSNGAFVIGSLKDAIAALTSELDRLIANLDDASRQHILLGQARDAKLPEAIAKATSLAIRAADGAEPLLNERLRILEAANVFREVLPETKEEINCPACGQSIAADAFARHVRGETSRLRAALDAYAQRSSAMSAVSLALTTVQLSLGDPRLVSLWSSPDWVMRKASIDAILTFDASEITGVAGSASLARLSALCHDVLPCVETAAGRVAPSTESLVKDRDKVKAAAEWSRGQELRRIIDGVLKLVAFISAAEDCVRGELRNQAEATLKSISSDVERMWRLLHRDMPIDDVHLYQHDGTDRAIDIGITFHGRKQPSPRLTLSEGYRNSLGLCVLLAMAKRGDPAPIILDDVVTSFDREHRGGVADLIKKELSGHQVIVLTHDADWYWDLWHRLPHGEWRFKSLLPFLSPETGIRWEGTLRGFAEARRQLEVDPSGAAAKARGIMDNHACIFAERLQVRVPFIRGPGNDRRHAKDLLSRIASQSKKSFRRLGVDGVYRPSLDLQAAAEDMASLLPSFSNTPAHGGYGTRGEAERLIEAGERILSTLECNSCEAFVTAVHNNETTQCRCGKLQWRF